jgi:membrane protein DedA with SNARE-associated domain
MLLYIYFSVLDAGIWISILVMLGYFLAQNQTLIYEHLREIIIGMLVFVAILISICSKFKK